MAVIVYAGRALLVRRHDDGSGLSWQFPAGEQELGETPEQTAVREVAEEVGLIVVPAAVLGERRHPITGRNIIYVACTTSSDAATVRDVEELADLAWCDHDTLLHRVENPFEPVVEYLQWRWASES